MVANGEPQTMLAAITIRNVERLAPGESIWDAGHKEAVRGFGCRRQSGAAVYVLKCRVLGRQRFVTIGEHGSPWTPVTARREAKRLLGQAVTGKDPQAAKSQARQEAADTVGRVAELYLAHAAKRLKPRSYVEVARHLRANCKPLHPVSVFTLTRRQVAERIAAINDAKGEVTAARARAALSAMFNWAIREGYEIAANPVAGSNRPPEPKARERVLTQSELAAIWTACGDDDYGRIVRLLILTAQRRDEVGAMRWNEVHGVEWIIPALRTKNRREHRVPLTPQALALLPPERKRDTVFGEGESGFQGWSKSKAGLDRRSDVADWRLHDLRRTAATVMADQLGVHTSSKRSLIM
ncbi:MAG TPA: integrase family protein [Xanthobacteraceae bacterium]|nr:integrase family protein [Xanthobacteraceae bacterium]